MRNLYRVLAALLFIAALNACATWGMPRVQLGQTEAEVVARLGRPTQVYTDGNTRLLEYMHGPMGQATEMARFGPDGKLVSYEQVLTLQVFSTIKIGEANKDSVLRTIGTPSEIAYYPLAKLEAWSYPFRENDVWDSLMTVYFDKTGIVRRLENGPDPKYQMNGDGFL